MVIYVAVVDPGVTCVDGGSENLSYLGKPPCRRPPASVQTKIEVINRSRALSGRFRTFFLDFRLPRPGTNGWMARPAQPRSDCGPLLVGVRDGSAPAPRDRRHRPPEQTQARAAVVPWRARDHACGACQVARRRQKARTRKPCAIERARARY